MYTNPCAYSYFKHHTSSWTIFIRHRFGAWNWLDRAGLVPIPTQRVFLRGDGKTMWSDGYYGEWYINPAINYFQIEKHYGRGAGTYYMMCISYIVSI
jgi:hypothetical protein